MSLKGKIEAIIYAAEEPVTLDQLAGVLKEAGLVEELMKPEQQEIAEASSDEVAAPAPAAPAHEQNEQDAKAAAKSERAAIRARLRHILDEMIAASADDDRGMEIRQVAGGYRISTKPEHHDVVKLFAKSLKPPVRLSLQALETLAVVAYKQPVTAPEISEIRGVDSTGVLATLIDRKLITTAGRKAVVGRPILYKTTKDFLMRFGLKDISELPSMEEFTRMTHGDDAQEQMFAETHMADATGVPDVPPEPEAASQQTGSADEDLQPSAASNDSTEQE
jgi:segregation and condensation protein B